MRKTLTIVLVLLLSWSLQAQKKKVNCTTFYAGYGLCPDSACTPYLYYKAHEWIGTRYRYAGKTRKGIDCSGFCKMLYSEVYCVPLSGGSRDIWPLLKPVKQDSLQEGDLVFFRIKKGSISHVGVYLGNHKFVHASVKYGVIVSDLQEPYYKKYYFSGGRFKHHE